MELTKDIYRFIDFEVFAHWWCVIAYDYDEEHFSKEQVYATRKIVTSNDKNARDKMIELLRADGVYLFGQNIKKYDLIIANAIWQGLPPEDVKCVSDIIINPTMQYSSKKHMLVARFAEPRCRLRKVKFQDLIGDNARLGLKEMENIMGCAIVECNVPFDKEELTNEDIDEIIYYCTYDVYATALAYKGYRKTYVNAKLNVAKTFNIDKGFALMNTNASLISKALNAVKREWVIEDDYSVRIVGKVKDYVYANAPKEIVDRILQSGKGFTVKMFDNTISFGNGGIHSVLRKKLYVEGDNEYGIFNVDATSFYPSIMIQLGLISRALTDPEDFVKVYNERVRIKHKKDKTYEDDQLQAAYKMVLNTTYGASGNQYLDIYDPYNCASVCRHGQILLFALMCKFSKIPTLKIIQSNTDGVMVYVARTQLPYIQKLCDEWSNVTGIGLEMDEVSFIYQKDVNNYIEVTTKDGKTKRKIIGAWLRRDGRIENGGFPTLKYNVCTEVAKKYLLEGKDILTELLSHNNLLDFAITCKKGATFSKCVHMIGDKFLEVNKINRVIATKNPLYGKLYKLKLKTSKLQEQYDEEDADWTTDAEDEELRAEIGRLKELEKIKDAKPIVPMEARKSLSNELVTYESLSNYSFSKMPSLPDHCLIVDEEINSYDMKEMRKQIDYMYYYEIILDLLICPSIKSVDWAQLYHNQYIDKPLIEID